MTHGQLLTPGGTFGVESNWIDEKTGESIYSESFSVRLDLARATESIGDLHELHRLEGERMDTGDRQSVWYQEREDGLYEVAHTLAGSGAGAAHARPGPASAYEPAMRSVTAQPSAAFEAAWKASSWLVTERSNSDEIYVRDPARKLYPSPIEVGVTWTEFDLGFLLRTSKIEGHNLVTTPAGRFNAYVILTDIEASYEPGEYISITSYVVPGRGMVLREVDARFRGRDESGQPVGWFQMTERVAMLSE